MSDQPIFRARDFGPFHRAGRAEVTEHVTLPGKPVDLAKAQGNQTWLDLQARSKWGQPAADRLPSEAAPPPEQRPAPVPPAPFESDSTLLRSKLAAAIDARSAAAEVLAKAQEAHERGEVHLSRCQNAAARFIALDSEVAEATAAALRTGDGRPRLDVQQDLQQRIVDRDTARTDLSAAEAALTVLLRERAAAITALQLATASVDQVVAQLLACHAEALAERHAALMSEAGVLLDRLMSVGQAVAGVRLGDATRKALGIVDPMALARPKDSGVWQHLALALKQDPQAALVVANMIS